MPQVYEVIIIGADPSTGNLTLNDNGLTGVTDPGDVDYIDWRIQAGIANIAKITGINYESGNTIFSNGPSPANDDGTWWHATVNPDAAVGSYENYSISWLDTSGNGHTFDPKIQIQS